jgi:hypothetical protein
MGQKFYSEVGERDQLSPKLLKISKECTEGRKMIFIPELRITVFTRLNETVEETRKRYLRNTLTYGKLKDNSNKELESVDVIGDVL